MIHKAGGTRIVSVGVLATWCYTITCMRARAGLAGPSIVDAQPGHGSCVLYAGCESCCEAKNEDCVLSLHRDQNPCATRSHGWDDRFERQPSTESRSSFVRSELLEIAGRSVDEIGAWLSTDPKGGDTGAHDRTAYSSSSGLGSPSTTPALTKRVRAMS